MVRDNVVSNDVTIMSSLHIDVIILGINLLFVRKVMVCAKNFRNCVYIC